jgi:hypothetical protein
MPEHTLERGKQIIEGLSKLGQALGYFVEPEKPVRREHINPPAVDVAWLSEEGQDFPLMIFEIESSATNTIANNAVKVFGQPNQEFEKPLFFFHIIVRGGQNSFHTEPLRTQFGTYNYRQYRLALKEDLILIKDILSQHRRLTRQLDLVSVVLALKNPAWPGLDLEYILLHIEELGFESGQGTFLPCYASLSSEFPEFQNHFLRYLQIRETSRKLAEVRDGYPTYFGQEWAYPIHLGLLTTLETTERKVKYLERLQQWQEHSWYFPQIGTRLGMFLEHDRFAFNLAGPFWALIAALMRDLPDAVLYIAQQCKALILEMESLPPDISVFTALWMLHITASTELAEKEFEFARNYINDRGGIPADRIYEPLGILLWEPIGEDRNLWISNSSNLRLIPTLRDFRMGYGPKSLTKEKRHAEAITLGIDALMVEDIWFHWSPDLVRLLLD